MSLAHPTIWRQRHFNGDGLLLWASGLGELASHGINKYNEKQMREVIESQKWDPNTVTNEGEKWILEAAFRNNPHIGGGTLTAFEIGLSTSAILAETTVYAGRAEHTDTTGYTAQSVAWATSGWTAATGDTPASVTTPAAGTYTFTATGTWTAVEAVILMTVGLTSERLLAWDNLSASRSLVNTDTLDVDLDITGEAV